ncbi:MAG: LysR family transcriptional regulator [Terriglobales bacterium]
MEVHQLRYFCAIVKHGTFTRAAECEHVAQPSLSQQILKLEDELGGKLFERLPRAAKLTPLGESFLPRASAILQQIQETKAEARRIVDLRRYQAELEAASSVLSDGLRSEGGNNRPANGVIYFNLRKSA